MECLAGRGVEVAVGATPRRDLSAVFLTASVMLSSSLLSSESDDELISRAGLPAPDVVVEVLTPRLVASSSSSDDEDEPDSDELISAARDLLLLLPAAVNRLTSALLLRPGSVDRDIAVVELSSSLDVARMPRDLLAVALLRRRLLAYIHPQHTDIINTLIFALSE